MLGAGLSSYMRIERLIDLQFPVGRKLERECLVEGDNLLPLRDRASRQSDRSGAGRRIVVEVLACGGCVHIAKSTAC